MTNTASPIIEIRSYNLKPGTGAAFHKLVIEQSMPMLTRWQVDVVAFGPSLQSEDSYFLVRTYKNLEHLQQSQDAFYGSDEWKLGPREAIISHILSYTNVVIAATKASIDALRNITPK
ncbi:MAG: NIPSNAP family protein [Bacteroidota bacterium]